MHYGVRLLSLILLTTLGCNCSSMDKPQARLMPSTEEADARVPIPMAPPPPESLECKSPTILIRARTLAPTVSFLMINAPEDGTDQLDSLAMGMGMESMCCASVMALVALRKAKADDTADTVEPAVQRTMGYIFSRCFEKPSEKTLNSI